VLFKSLGAVSCSPSIVIMAVSVAVCEIFSDKEWCDLKTGLGFVQGHRKWHHLIVGRVLAVDKKVLCFFTGKPVILLG